jgi:allantoinase
VPITTRNFVGYGQPYPRIAWPNHARIAISLVVNFEEGSERTPFYGDATTDAVNEGFGSSLGWRDLRNESFFEYGSRRAFWRLLDIFDDSQIKVTYNACAMALANNPVAARAITEHGHEPCSHGYRWLPLYTLSRAEEREHIHKAVAVIEETTGQRPLGWNSRGPSEHTRDLLAEEGGFLYESDTYADDLPYFVQSAHGRMLSIPYSFETNDQKYFLGPGHSGPHDFLAQLQAGFDWLYAEGASHPQMMSVGIHMRHSGRPAGASAIEDFIRYARGFPGVWFARRIDIARWWLEHYSDFEVMSS